jgi:ABC-2 type transport system ATP-binding protein
MTTNTILEAENLTRRYWRHTAVDNLTLSMPRGSLCAFLGRNGAGKTTTIKMLAGLVRPTAGASRLRGQNSQSLRPTDWQRIGYVSENQKLYDWMRVGELIAFTRKLYPQWDEQFEKDLTRKFSLPLDRKIKSCSLGEQRKLALLLSLAYRPELLILDEPFSGLDVLVKDEFLAGLLELTQQNEWSVFFSTHDIAEVERLADQVMIVEKGKLELNESLESLQQRFRRVQIYQDLPPEIDTQSVLDLQQGDSASSFTHPRWTQDLEAQWRARFGSAIEIKPMSLHDLFLSLARSYQNRAL